MDESMCVYRLGGAASWTTLMKQGDYEKKQQDYAEAMTVMYRGFDTFSGGRFHNTVEHAIHRLKFLTQVNTKHYETVLNKENREFYRELNARTRFLSGLRLRHRSCMAGCRSSFTGDKRSGWNDRTSRSGRSE